MHFRISTYLTVVGKFYFTKLSTVCPIKTKKLMFTEHSQLIFLIRKPIMKLNSSLNYEDVGDPFVLIIINDNAYL